MARNLAKRRKSNRKADRKYRKNNPEKIKASRKKYHYKLRRDALAHYGGKCACCDEKEFKFLAIDHMGNDGNVHRKSIGSRGGSTMYRWLKKNNYPAGFQVLCHNCNMAKAFYNICPHKENRSSPGPMKYLQIDGEGLCGRDCRAEDLKGNLVTG